jgi:anthranilate phosphoribosyltransferase
MREAAVCDSHAAAAGLHDAVRLLEDGCSDLGYGVARSACESVLSGDVAPALTARFLWMLGKRGETASELFAAIDTVRARQSWVGAGDSRAVDVGGTGGDGGRTFNVSTTAAIVAAAAGARVHKHGGRAASGRCGSIDLLEALDVRDCKDAAAALVAVDARGIAFLASESFLPYPRWLRRMRRELGTRTIFNLIGPWCNPARVERQVVGVADERLVEVFGTIAQRLGLRRALIVHGRCGAIDEFAPVGETVVLEVNGASTREYEVSPADFGLPTGSLSEVAGGGAEVNARHAAAVIEGVDRGPRQSIVLLTAAAALYVSDVAATLGEGVELARDAILSGRASALLSRLRQA